MWPIINRHAPWRHLLKRPLISCLLGGSLLVFAFMWPSAPMSAAKAALFVVQAAPLSQDQQFKGRVFPLNSRPLTSPSDSIVDNLLVKEGASVKKGQLLATLRSSKLENEWLEAKQNWLAMKQKYDAFSEWHNTQSVQSAKHQKIRAERELKRAKESYLSAERLYALGIVSQNEVCDLKTILDDRALEFETAQKEWEVAESKGEGPEKEMAKLALHLAQQKLDTIEQKKKALSLEAPFDGWVLWPEPKSDKEQKNNAPLFPQEGNAYKENETVLAVCDASGFNVHFSIDEFLIGKIKPGMSVKISVPQLQSTPFDGKIKQVSAKGEFDSGGAAAQFKAVAEIFPLALHDFVFRTGLSATVALTDKKPVITLPLNAFYEKDKKYFVTLKTQSGNQERLITIQETTPTGAIVSSGLKQGDEIVISHHAQ